MLKFGKFPWLKQFAILVTVICAIGYCATFLVYRQAKESTTASSRAYLLTTAVQSAQFVKESGAGLG